jgi:HJR/Mrr/RecB family endonuclease
MFPGVLFRMVVVTELVSKLLHKKKVQALSYTIALVTEMYAKLLRMFRYRRTVMYFTVESVELTQHNKRHLQVVFHASIDKQAINT